MTACAVALAAGAGVADGASLPPGGPGQRPGPDLLYTSPAVAPQLTNRAPWRARPIIVSGATSYRKGESLCSASSATTPTGCRR